MTTTVAPDLESDHSESEQPSTLGRDLADATREHTDARSYDPTQGRKIGTDPYDDPTQGRKIGADPHDDPTQGRKIGSHPYDDPTQGRKIWLPRLRRPHSSSLDLRTPAPVAGRASRGHGKCSPLRGTQGRWRLLP